MFRKFIKRLIGEVIEEREAGSPEAAIRSVDRMYEEARRHCEEAPPLHAETRHEVIGDEPTTGLVPNTEQRARLADAAAIVGRGRSVPKADYSPRRPEFISGQTKPKRGPQIVNPESMEDILAAMRK